MERTEKERLIEFIEFNNMSIREFERQCHLGNNAVQKIGKKITPAKMSKISQRFPNLNLTWLRTGEGSMIRETLNDIKGEVEELKRDKEHLQKLVGMLEKENAELRAENDELRRQLDKKEGAESSLFDSANNQQDDFKVS